MKNQPQQYRDFATGNFVTLPHQETAEYKLAWLSIGDLKVLLDHAKWSQDQLTPKDSTNLHDYWHNIIEKTSHELANKITEIFPFES